MSKVLTISIRAASVKNSSASARHNTDRKHRTEVLGYEKVGCEVLKDESFEDVARRYLTDAVDEYNKRQIENGHRERVKDVMEYARGNDKHSPEMELIVGIGNISSTGMGQVIREEASQMLREYFDRFEKENPQMYVRSCAIHCDEKGAAHMHMICDPIACNMRIGPSVKIAEVKTLREMGYCASYERIGDSSKKMLLTERAKWVNGREKPALMKILKKHGFEGQYRDIGIDHRHHITTRLYKEVMKGIDELVRNDFTDWLGDIDARESIAQNGKAQITIDKTDFEKLQKVLAYQNSTLRTMEQGDIVRKQREIDRKTMFDMAEKAFRMDMDIGKELFDMIPKGEDDLRQDITHELEEDHDDFER